MTVSSDMLWRFNADFDLSKLRDDVEDRGSFQQYFDPLTGAPVVGWQYKLATSAYALETAGRIAAAAGAAAASPRYILTRPGVTIPWHRDRGTLCAVNILLQGEGDPINFRHGAEHYHTALINTQAEHALLNVMTERVLFKVSISDRTFDQVLVDLRHSGADWLGI